MLTGFFGHWSTVSGLFGSVSEDGDDSAVTGSPRAADLIDDDDDVEADDGLGPML
jgi:hypothetical protein